MRSTFGIETVTISWGTSATTASTTLSDLGKVLGVKFGGIVWPAPGAVASGCSSVEFFLYDGDVTSVAYMAGSPKILMSSALIASGGKARGEATVTTAGFFGVGASAGTVFVAPGYSILASSCDYHANARIVSGAATSIGYFPKATVILYLEY